MTLALVAHTVVILLKEVESYKEMITLKKQIKVRNICGKLYWEDKNNNNKTPLSRPISFTGCIAT